VVIVASRKELGVMETKAKCKFCHRSYLYHQGGSTTTLNRHLDKCTQYLNKLAQAKKNLAQGSLSFTSYGGPIVVNPTEYDHEHTRVLIAKMIIVHEYAFRMVEHKWFSILMKWMNNNYESIGRKTIKNECMKIYESKKELIKKSLREAESISLTTDLWSSNQNIQYMCLVAHYVDVDWHIFLMTCRGTWSHGGDGGEGELGPGRGDRRGTWSLYFVGCNYKPVIVGWQLASCNCCQPGIFCWLPTTLS
jgi:hypothetical protein